MPTIGGRAGFAGTTVVYCWEGHQAPSLSGRLVLADKGRMRPSRSSAVTIALGLGVLGFSLTRISGVGQTALALFLAAVILVELFEESDGERAREPMQWERFHLAASVQIAAVIMLGPWAGALVAAAGVVAGGLFRGRALRDVAFAASAGAIAACLGGLAFEVAGGNVGSLHLLADLIALVALALVYVTARALLLDVVRRRETFDPLLVAGSGEVGLGATLALLAIGHPWDVTLLVPVAIAVQQVQVRLKSVQRETLRALETFANIVDERDPSTYRHSLRVAGYVDGLARALQLPFSEIDRLRWAGRLHDLGKVAVDASLLRKREHLDGLEWAAMRRHPRLSARLLQRFEFVSGQARDRPYRTGLTHEDALREIERHAGTQFHSAVAKAFVAVQRGADPATVLSAEELAELRGATAPYRIGLAGPGELKERPELVALGGVVVALAGLGFAQGWLAASGGGIAVAGLALRALIRMRAERAAAALHRAVDTGEEGNRVFLRLAKTVTRVWKHDWIALISWDEDGLGGSIEQAFGDEPLPAAALTGLLVREAESGRDAIVAPGVELGRSGVVVALPLRRDNSALVGFLVVAAPKLPPRHVELALLDSLDEIGLALADRPELGGRAGQNAQPLETVADERDLALARLDER
ncbi:MAG: HD domain-containing protein [Actinobacteria bacterium]|nr:MAG: HD domain-containing protein [Actinomycetota bacterium]